MGQRLQTAPRRRVDVIAPLPRPGASGPRDRAWPTEAEQHEIEDHLYSDDQPSGFGLGGDVAEPNRRQHGDVEVEGVSARDRLAEGGGIGPRVAPQRGFRSPAGLDTSMW